MITITGYSGSSTIISLPTTISGVRVSMISGSVFAGKSITAITGDSILSISSDWRTSGTFANCTNLTTASFPRCSIIDNATFKSCTSLSGINMPEITFVGPGTFAKTAITSVSFSKCSKIWGDSLESNGAFYSCKSLQSAHFSICTSIGSNTFYECNTLSDISFPACTYIDHDAFYNCASLATISFPVCSYIGASAFYWTAFVSSQYSEKGYAEYSNSIHNFLLFVSGRFSLFSTVFSANNTFICDSAFTNINLYSRLTEINMPMCKYVGSYAIVGYTAVSKMTFGNCSMIENGAFRSCTSLSEFYLPGSTFCTLYGSSVFSGTGITSSTGSIFVNANLVSAYKSEWTSQGYNNPWYYFSNIIQALPDENAWDTNPYSGSSIFTDGYIIC